VGKDGVTHLVSDLITNIESHLNKLEHSNKKYTNQKIQKKSSLSLSIIPPSSGLTSISRLDYVDDKHFLNMPASELVTLEHELHSVSSGLNALSVGKAKGQFLNELGELAVQNEWDYKVHWMMCELYRTTFQLFRPEKSRANLLNPDSYLGGLFNLCLNLGSTERSWLTKLPIVKSFALETRERYVDSNVKGFEKTREYAYLNTCPAKYLAQISTWLKALPSPPTMEVDLQSWKETFHPSENIIPGKVYDLNGKCVAEGTPVLLGRALNTIPNGLQDIKNIFRCTEGIETPANLSWLKHSGCFERSIEAGGALKVLSTMIPIGVKESLRKEDDILKRLKGQVKIFEELFEACLDQLADYIHDCPIDVRKCTHSHAPLLHLPILSRGFKARHLTMGSVAVRFLGSVIQKFATKWLRNMPVTAELLQPNANWARSNDRAYRALIRRFNVVFFHSGDLDGCTNHYLKEVSQAMISKGLTFFRSSHPKAREVISLVLGYFTIYMSRNLDLRFRSDSSVIRGFESYLDLVLNENLKERHAFMQLLGQHMGMPLSFPVMGGMHQALYDIVYPPERYDLDFAPLFEIAHTHESPLIRQIVARASHRRCAGKMQIQLGVDESGALEHHRMVAPMNVFNAYLANMVENDPLKRRKFTPRDEQSLKKHTDYQHQLCKSLWYIRDVLKELRLSHPEVEFTCTEKLLGTNASPQKNPKSYNANGQLILEPELPEFYGGSVGKPCWENKSSYFTKYISGRMRNPTYQQVKSDISIGIVAITIIIEFSIKTAKEGRFVLWVSDTEVEEGRLDALREIHRSGRYLVKSACYERVFVIRDNRIVSLGKLFTRESDGMASSAGDDLSHVTANLENVKKFRTRATQDFNQSWNKKADYCSTTGYVIAERLGRVHPSRKHVFPEFYVKIKQLVADPGSQQVESWMDRASSIRTSLTNEFKSWTTEAWDPQGNARRYLYRIIENAEEIFYYNNKKSIDLMIENSLDPRLDIELGGYGVWKGLQTPHNELTLEYLRLLTYLSKYERQLLPRFVKKCRTQSARHRVSRSLGKTKQIVKPGSYEIPRKKFKELYYSLLGWIDQLEDETSVNTVSAAQVANDLRTTIRLWSGIIKNYDPDHIPKWGEIKMVFLNQLFPSMGPSGVGIVSPVTAAYRAGNSKILPSLDLFEHHNRITNRLYGEIDIAYIRDHINDDERVMLVDEKSFKLYTDLLAHETELKDAISAHRSEGLSEKQFSRFPERLDTRLDYWELDPEPGRHMESLRMATRLRAHNQRRGTIAPLVLDIIEGINVPLPTTEDEFFTRWMGEYTDTGALWSEDQ
jgi:hypothetical protein